MTREAFRLLLDIIRRDIYSFQDDQELEEIRKHISGNETQAATKLAAFLRVMAGGDPLDISLALEIGESNAYKYFQDFMKAVNNRLDFASIPRTEGLCKNSALEFATSRPYLNPFPGCVGAIDGISIMLQKPLDKYRPASFYCRTGYCPFAAQDFVDDKYRFIAISAFCKGSTHDSTALEMSNIGRFVHSGSIPKGYWVAGDDAYTVRGCIITTFRKEFLTKYTDSYNFYHYSQRVHVEQAFGMLVSKWRVLKSPLMFSLSANSKAVTCAARLHNFCIEFSDSPDEPPVPCDVIERAVKELRDRIIWQRHEVDPAAHMDTFNENVVYTEGVKRALQRSNMRHDQVRILQRRSLIRPLWARPRYSVV